MKNFIRPIATTFAFLGFGMVHAQSIDGSWTISNYHGDAIFVEPETLIGRQQIIQGGFAEGPLYACDFAGQYMTYTSYSRKEFLDVKEFSIVHDIVSSLEDANTIFVNRLNCSGNGEQGLSGTLYPFVTSIDAMGHDLSVAFVIFDGGVIELSR
ncbi:hypothetical protein MWN63_15645 [Paradonghicola geojensis]|nr:hypothetical protein [Marivivens geojensis]